MFGNKKPDISTIATLIGAGTTVTGGLEFRGGLHLDGRIVGDVAGEPGGSKLTMGASGIIEGSVVVDDLVLNGAVRGDVHGRERVELGTAAQVDGNVSYKLLQMAAGARVNGRLIHHPDGRQALPAPDEAGSPGASHAEPRDEIPRLG
jgi:cytoskeletal protein CcmA (bactofilin family)